MTIAPNLFLNISLIPEPLTLNDIMFHTDSLYHSGLS